MPKLIISILCISLFLCNDTFCDGTNSEEVVVEIPKPTISAMAAVKITNHNYLILGTHGGFKIYNVDNPISPVKESEIIRYGMVTEIETDGNYAYFAIVYPFDYDIRELLIVDISRPKKPKVIDLFPIFKDEVDFCVKDKYIYEADGHSELLNVFQMSKNRKKIVNIAEIKIGGYVNSVVINGDTLFVENDVNASCFNIRDRRTPQYIEKKKIGYVNKIKMQTEVININGYTYTHKRVTNYNACDSLSDKSYIVIRKM